MEHYHTLQQIDGHSVTMGILYCFGVFVAGAVVVVKLFQRWG